MIFRADWECLRICISFVSSDALHLHATENICTKINVSTWHFFHIFDHVRDESKARDHGACQNWRRELDRNSALVLRCTFL